MLAPRRAQIADLRPDGHATETLSTHLEDKNAADTSAGRCPWKREHVCGDATRHNKLSPVLFADDKASPHARAIKKKPKIQVTPRRGTAAPKIPEADWLFGEFKCSNELRACLLWECARELPYIANWLNLLGEKTLPVAKTAARAAIEEKLLALPTPEFAKYFPGNFDAIRALLSNGLLEAQRQRAWKNLERSEQQNIINLVSHKALKTQPLFNEAIVRYVAEDLLSDWKKIGEQPCLGPHKNPRAGLLVIELNPYSWTGFAKEDIIEEFTQMLDSEEWAPVPVSERWKGKFKGFSDRNIRMMLDELGIIRLMHAHSHREAGKILKLNGFGRRARGITEKDRLSVFEQLVGCESEVTPPGPWNRHRRQFGRRFLRLFQVAPISFPLRDDSWATRNRKGRPKGINERACGA